MRLSIFSFLRLFFIVGQAFKRLRVFLYFRQCRIKWSVVMVFPHSLQVRACSLVYRWACVIFLWPILILFMATCSCLGSLVGSVDVWVVIYEIFDVWGGHIVPPILLVNFIAGFLFIDLVMCSRCVSVSASMDGLVVASFAARFAFSFPQIPIYEGI